MADIMEERVIMALAVILIGVAVYQLFRRWHMAQASQPGSLAVTLPTILYFQSDSCAACPTQSRFLDQLAGEWHGRVSIQKIDADREPERASHYRVFTLPTTILVDAAGNIQKINYGLTNSQKLVQQLKKYTE